MNTLSTIFWPTLAAVNGQHSYIILKWNGGSSLYINRYMTCLSPHPRNQHQWCVTNFLSRMIDHPRAVQQHESIINIFASFLGNNAGDHSTTATKKFASMERQWVVIHHLKSSNGCAKALTRNQCIGNQSRQKPYLNHRFSILKWILNRASTVVGHATSIINGLCNCVNP